MIDTREIRDLIRTKQDEPRDGLIWEMCEEIDQLRAFRDVVQKLITPRSDARQRASYTGPAAEAEIERGL